MERLGPARFVYFDLDDTLLDHRSAERAALAELHDAHPEFSRVDLDRFRDVYHRVNVVVWREYGSGQLTKQQARHVRFGRLLEALGVTGPDPEALGDAYLDRYAGHWRFLPGAGEAFRRIADRLPVGIVTNGFAEIQRAKFDRFPELVERSRVVLVSEEVGYMKPDRRLFDLAATRAECPPADLLYVGDSLHSDVEGALGAGWRVAWFNGRREAAPPGVPVFDDWQELVEAVVPAA